MFCCCAVEPGPTENFGGIEERLRDLTRQGQPVEGIRTPGQPKERLKIQTADACDGSGYDTVPSSRSVGALQDRTVVCKTFF